MHNIAQGKAGEPPASHAATLGSRTFSDPRIGPSSGGFAARTWADAFSSAFCKPRVALGLAVARLVYPGL